jgi:8-oxo-dGTP diphosphatase
VKALLSRLFRMLPSPFTRFVVGWLNARFNVSVAGVFFSADGRVLVLRHVFRRQYPWGLPAGFLKAGETPGEAIVREVREETGLEVTVTRLLSLHVLRPGHLEAIVMGRADAAQPIQPSAEIFEGAFVTPDNLPAGMMPSQGHWVGRALGSHTAAVIVDI